MAAMNERRISLDGGLLRSGGQDAGLNPRDGKPDAPVAGDVLRFQEALRTADAAKQTPQAPMASPFSLFGQTSPAAQTATPQVAYGGANLASSIALDDVIHTANALMVSGDGQRTVRLTVAADVLPHTSVVIEERHGTLVVVFEVGDEAAAILRQQGASTADAIAKRLQREVHVEGIHTMGESIGYWRGLPQ
jgi:nitrate reductase NapAB chaperone NapD